MTDVINYPPDEAEFPDWWETALEDMRTALKGTPNLTQIRAEFRSLIQRTCAEHCAQYKIAPGEFTVELEQEVWRGVWEGKQYRIQGVHNNGEWVVVDENDHPLQKCWEELPQDVLHELAWVYEESYGVCRNNAE